MKKCCLLACMALLVAGCASPSGTDPAQSSRKERMADANTPTGTFIPRKKSQRGAENSGEIDKQAFENERMSNSGTNNGIGR